MYGTEFEQSVLIYNILVLMSCFLFQGKRKGTVAPEEKAKPELYQIRSNGGILAKRVIQVLTVGNTLSSDQRQTSPFNL